MTLTRRQFLAGTVALPVVGLALAPSAPRDFSTSNMVFKSREWKQTYDWTEYGSWVRVDAPVHSVGSLNKDWARVIAEETAHKREQLAVNLFSDGFNA